MDNKPLPVEIDVNVVNYASKKYDKMSDKIRFIQGATYGYNLAQVFVEDLKSLIQHLKNRIDKLENNGA